MTNRPAVSTAKLINLIHAAAEYPVGMPDELITELTAGLRDVEQRCPEIPTSELMNFIMRYAASETKR